MVLTFNIPTDSKPLQAFAGWIFVAAQNKYCTLQLPAHLKKFGLVSKCLQEEKVKEKGWRIAFFKGIPSLSGSIPCIAIKVSAGVMTGPELEDPWT